MKRKYLKGRIEIKKATQEDGIYIGNHLREADQHEGWSASRMRPVEMCTYSIQSSQVAFSILLDGEPIGIFGVADYSVVNRSGVIWFLGTDRIKEIGYLFVKYTRPFIKIFLSRWDRLMNQVHSENKESLRWLKLSGFKIDEPMPYGYDQELFHYIEIRRN